MRSGASSEHATGSAHKIAQLERENANMREVIKKLTSEIAEIKHARGTRPPPASAPLETPQPMEVPIAEGEHDEARPSKKRAVVHEQDSLPGRVKSEIREMFSALSDSVRQLAEKVSQIQSEMAFQAQSMNKRVSKLECFLENVMLPISGHSVNVVPHITIGPPVTSDNPSAENGGKGREQQDGGLK